MTIATTTPHETYEGLHRQFMALRTLAASLEKQVGLLRRELKDQTQAQADLEAERATNAQLTEALLAAEAERDQLKAENEALRKDAERWRFVRDPLSTKSPFAIWGERKTLFLGRLADSAIDAAMSKEVQP